MVRRKAPCYSVYIVRCRDGVLYTGIALDVVARVAQHNAGKGARFTRGRCPIKLLISRIIGARGKAQQVEAAIKRLPRKAKIIALRLGDGMACARKKT